MKKFIAAATVLAITGIGIQTAKPATRNGQLRGRF
jgi:hypothetical protein